MARPIMEKSNNTRMTKGVDMFRLEDLGVGRRSVYGGWSWFLLMRVWSVRDIPPVLSTTSTVQRILALHRYPAYPS